MAYTFGGATTDSVLWTGQNNMGNAGVGLVMGWWKPSTLAATRRLWSSGTVTGCAIDTSTSELRVTNDSFSGTDGVYTTTGAGLATGAWSFVACLVSIASTPTSQWKVWVGNLTTAPTEVTISTVSAITTNLNGPLGNFTIGNTSGGSVAFQGDIDNVFMMNDGASAGSGHVLGIGTLGAISTDEATLVLERWIKPYWMGLMPAPDQFYGSTTALAAHWDGGFGATARQWARSGVASTDPLAPTYSGVTYTADRCPRPTLAMVGNY